MDKAQPSLIKTLYHFNLHVLTDICIEFFMGIIATVCSFWAQAVNRCILMLF